MEKAELQIFGNQGRVEMRKRNFTPLEDQAEMGCKSRAEVWKKQKFRFSAVKAEWKCGGGTSHLWKWRPSVSGDAELQIFDSQGGAEVRKRNVTSLEVQAEMTCGSGTLHLWKS